MRPACPRSPITCRTTASTIRSRTSPTTGCKAAEQYRNKTGSRLVESGSEDEFLTRAMRRAIDEDTARLEYGQTVLASIGVHRALRRPVRHGVGHLPRAGQHRHERPGSLDKVAGPVGEALIMTALGLAVAIPAVLAYNFFNRANRQMLSEARRLRA